MIKHIKHSPKHVPWVTYKEWDNFYQIKSQDDAFVKIQWCKDNIVPEDWTMSLGGEMYYFLKNSDAIMFELRWENNHD